MCENKTQCMNVCKEECKCMTTYKKRTKCVIRASDCARVTRGWLREPAMTKHGRLHSRRRQCLNEWPIERVRAVQTD